MKPLLLDTNVIYSNTLRDLFMSFSVEGVAIRWSVQIEREFVIARGRQGSAAAKRAGRVLSLMRAAAPGHRAVVSPRLLGELVLPDPDDRHVLAAAIGAEADIVTSDRRDFPTSVLDRHGVRRFTPDQALAALYDDDPARAERVARAVLSRLINPPFSRQDWLSRLREIGLAAFPARLAP